MSAAPPAKRHPYNQWSPDARALDLIGDKWTLLIVRDLAGGPRRFVELQRVLPGISTEQLRSRLNRMVADDLLTRERFREVPPRVDYALTDRARDLLPVIGELARWGYAWAWGAPRPREAIDIGAIFRATFALIGDHPGLRGTVALLVDEDDGARAFVVRVGDEGVELEEGTNPAADALVSGSRSAWIAALGPERSRAGLRFAEDRLLGERLLDCVTSHAVAVPFAARERRLVQPTHAPA
jgi:DNA-binding HxlR family transcriptional regulator